jgi:GrpB-like predicted nucleotidyltransferase (UPF0157 family)
VDRQERDAYLDRVLVGGLEKQEIVIAEYDAAWPQRFVEERERVRAALGRAAIRIEHIGSTAVPGLAAKPIVDVLVTVQDPEREGIIRSLEKVGYELRVRELGHRMFRTPARDVHVHVWGDGDPEVRRHLAFRDQLRRSAEDRVAYERLKRDLAKRPWNDMNEYADAKDHLVAEILAKTGP